MQTGGSGDRKERKAELSKARLISCGLCPYNKGENAKRKAKPDKHKNIDHSTIRTSESVFDNPDFVSVEYEDDDVWGRE